MRSYLVFLLALLTALLAGAAAVMVLRGLGFGTLYDDKGTAVSEQSAIFATASILAAAAFWAAGKLMGLRVTPSRVALVAAPPFLIFQLLLWQVPWLEPEAGAALLTLLLMATLGYLPFRPVRGTP